MPLVPVTYQSWLFSPPLELPLQPRLENGRFDSLRRRTLPNAPACTTTQIIPAGDPRNPTSRDVHFSHGLHQAVELASEAGNCVYAAYSGRVVKVEVQPGGNTANLSIDHHPRGLGFVTNYNHIDEVQVEVGDFVREGEPIAQVSAVPEIPTLHFELWAVIDRSPEGDDSFGDSDMLPIDPTRALYAWERKLTADEPLAGPQVPLAVGVTRINTIHFFFARFDGEVTLHVPMYEPMTEDERVMVELLREARRRGDALELSLRHSSFWGVDVATQAELA
jgi:biotin carboxyl carrier protein